MDILSEVKELNENQLREKIIVPLLHTLDFEDIYVYHGSREKGKDIVYKVKNVYGDVVVGAIILKRGNIKTQSLKREIRTQTEESVEAFIYPGNHSETIYISELAIITSGSLSRDALEYLNTHCRKNFPNVFILDGNKINTLIIKAIRYYNQKHNKSYTFTVDTFKDVCFESANYIDEPINNLSATEDLESGVLK